MNTRCNERVNANSNYYVGTSDAGVLNGSPSYTIDHIHRGYLCETRVIHTVAGNILCNAPDKSGLGPHKAGLFSFFGFSCVFVSRFCYPLIK